MATITGKTLIPISTLAVISGGIIWLSQIYSTANANSKHLERIEVKTMAKDQALDVKHEKVYDMLIRIDERLSRIEGRLDNR